MPGLHFSNLSVWDWSVVPDIQIRIIPASPWSRIFVFSFFSASQFNTFMPEVSKIGDIRGGPH
jgi:hypothetical protein